VAKQILCGFGVDIDAVAGWLGSYGGEDSPVVSHPDYVNRAVEGIAQAERIIIIPGPPPHACCHPTSTDFEPGRLICQIPLSVIGGERTWHASTTRWCS
jgi:hypothetical protein